MVKGQVIMMPEEFIRIEYAKSGYSEEEIDKVLHWRKDAQVWKENYDKTHKLCPDCGKVAYPPNYLGGFIFKVCENYDDGCNKNSSPMECTCGWKGIVDDLKGDKNVS
jgi:predicted RNA-binding Zn-ribbon protein involved in translation (DUF1610 family)